MYLMLKTGWAENTEVSVLAVGASVPCLLTVFQVTYHHLDDRLYFWIKTQLATQTIGRNVPCLGCPGYRVEPGMLRPVPGVEQ